MSEAALITSTSNTRVKWIRKLVRDRKERQQSGLFYIEGLRIVTEAVQVGAQIDTLLVAPDLLDSAHGLSMVEQQRKLGLPDFEPERGCFQEHLHQRRAARHCCISASRLADHSTRYG
jgi:tRNA G18 (ribose-2'-O)-methylase SpoU